MNTERMNYLPPVVEIIEMENEGVMAASGVNTVGVGPWGNGGDFSDYEAEMTSRGRR